MSKHSCACVAERCVCVWCVHLPSWPQCSWPRFSCPSTAFSPLFSVFPSFRFFSTRHDLVIALQYLARHRFRRFVLSLEVCTCVLLQQQLPLSFQEKFGHIFLRWQILVNGEVGVLIIIIKIPFTASSKQRVCGICVSKLCNTVFPYSI